jgi:hypothetical protein
MNAATKKGIESGSNCPADPRTTTTAAKRREGEDGGVCALTKEVAESLCRSNPDFERVVQHVKGEFNTNVRPILEKRKDIVLMLGQAINDYRQNAIQKQDICVAIKFFLTDEISEGLISGRDVERYCPEEWKRKTKPRREWEGEENDNLSFSYASARSPEATVGESKTYVRDDTAETNYEKKYAMVVNALAEANAQLQSVTADIKKREADIQLLKQERDELKGLLEKCSFKPASQYAEEPTILKKRLREQADLLRHFTVRTTMEVRGSTIPLLVEVMPASMRANVSLDEEKAKELGLQ